MDFDDYQDKAMSFALPAAFRLEYLIPALCEETGEVASLYSKCVRKDYIDPINIDKMAKELGDVLWNIAGLCSYFELSLSDVAELNIDKLTERKVRGTIAERNRNE